MILTQRQKNVMRQFVKKYSAIDPAKLADILDCSLNDAITFIQDASEPEPAKKHDTYNGRKQTAINRAKFEIVEETQEA